MEQRGYIHVSEARDLFLLWIEHGPTCGPRTFAYKDLLFITFHMANFTGRHAIVLRF